MGCSGLKDVGCSKAIPNNQEQQNKRNLKDRLALFSTQLELIGIMGR
jgi:hypothetical protein